MEEEIKRFKFIGLNDKASQEHLLQNTLILSGFYSSVPEYSRAVTPQFRQAGNRLSGLAETAYASLLA